MSLPDRLSTVQLIFLDTAPVIYFIENHPFFAPKVQPIFDRLDNGSLTALVSPITLAECLVLPYKLGQSDIIQLFTNLLARSQNVLFKPIDETIADRAANLRARYDLTLTDAFQIATAIEAGCDSFLTNDIDLKRVTEIPVFIVSE